MKLKRVAAICAGITLLGSVGFAQAALTTIGTATYGGADYNLILDDDNHGNMVVWLDYTQAPAPWSTQNSWAATLDAALTINTFGYDIDWGDSSWRLPTGFPAKEFDDLWANEFGFVFGQGAAANGSYTTDELNRDGFTNLTASSYYWTSTYYYGGDARNYFLAHGYENIWGAQYWGSGLAVHTVNSSDVLPTPVPGAFILFGSGLLGLGVVKRKKT